MKHKLTLPALLACVGVALPLWCNTMQAATLVTASETIEDTCPLDPLTRDLLRTRETSLGYLDVQGFDPTIVTQNSVDNDFGIVNLSDVSYTHKLDWLTPPAGSYLNASLQISAFGVLGGNEVVFADTWQLGSLINSTLIPFQPITTTLFSLGTGSALDVLLADGTLSILIDKNRQGRWLENLNASSVIKSTLSVSYETAGTQSVPEPGSSTAASGLVGLLGWLAYRRRK